MAAYVDPLRDWGWRLGPSSHLIADSLDELHAFARSLGLKREWFQDKGFVPHYDLTERRRRTAVMIGVVELTGREFVRKLREIRKSWTPLNSPSSRRKD